MKKLTYLLLLFSTVVFSQTAGSVDTSFNTIDAGYDIISGTEERVWCSKIQSDGKIIIGGQFTTYNGVNVNNIARLNTDGTLDTTFNIGIGFIGTNSVFKGIRKIALQADGKIIVAGGFISFNGITCKDLVRLNSNGTLDTSFNTGLGFNNNLSSILLQPDGKIFVCGAFTSFNNIPTNYLVKLNSDGSIDSSFDSTNSGADATINDVAIQTDGKVIIGGSFSNYAGIPYSKIARLNTDGTLDSSFNIGTGFSTGTVNSITIQTNGKIIIGGAFISFNGTTINNLIRLNTNGTLDTSYVTGTGPSGSVTSINLQTDGKILILGTFTTYNNVNRNKIARINTDGSLDTSFDIESVFIRYLSDPTIGWSTYFFSVSFQPDGKIILTGIFQTNYFSGANIKRLNTNGTFDNSFNTKALTGANWPVNSIAIQNDGKIIVGGAFEEYNSYQSPGIVRLNIDGTIDYSFLSNFTFGSSTQQNSSNTVIKDVAIQSDDKIIVVGTLYESLTSNNITGCKRLEVDGTFDSSFVIPLGYNLLKKIRVQTDGKVLVNGPFTKNIARFNTDGTLDTTFNVGTGFSGLTSNGNDIKIQNDGKILVGGTFTSYNGITRSGIARINSNGVYDTTFTGTGAAGTVNAIAIQNDGKILIGGNFGTYNGTSTNGITRINSDGTIDNSFATASSYSVQSICIQPDGKIIISASNRIIRLNSDGSVDATFISGLGADGSYASNSSYKVTAINSIVLQSDGKLLFGGNFTSYNAIGKNRIVRLNAANALAINENNIKNTFTIYPNPAKDNFTIDFGNEIVANYTLKVSNMLGQEVYSTVINKQQFTVTKTWQGTGMYFVKLYDEQNNVVALKKIILE